jgi:hypothetical protein
MLVRLSETTYQRLISGLGLTVPVISEDDHGFKYVEVDDEIIEAVREAFGDDIDWSINQTINENQRTGKWPKGKTSKI